MTNTQITQIVVATIVAISSMAAAWLSNKAHNGAAKIEQQMKIRQARLDERDLIYLEKGFQIPVENDDLWRAYYKARQYENKNRKDASIPLKEKIPLTTKKIVEEPLSD